jgi:hypothetical protein
MRQNGGISPRRFSEQTKYHSDVYYDDHARPAKPQYTENKASLVSIL